MCTIVTELQRRSTAELKADIKTVFSSNDEGSTTVFVLALNVLEKRISQTDYDAFVEEIENL